MKILSTFHPDVQLYLEYISTQQSLEAMGQRIGVTKQAIDKRFTKIKAFLSQYGEERVDPQEYHKSLAVAHEQKNIIQTLKKENLIKSAKIRLLMVIIENVMKVFPTFITKRLPAPDKLYLLELVNKYTKAGGLFCDFAKAIKRSPQTLASWKAAYEQFGLNGLVDKKTRPKNFGNSVPSFVRNLLVMLFTKFPNWTAYQYHNHIKYNPATNWYLSLPTIQKLKSEHQVKSAAEKDRIIKRWAFAPGTNVWSMDFTTILQTPHYKLQLLTISDHRSRYLFKPALFLNTSTELVMQHLEDLFLVNGKPNIIKADGGPEFRLECRSDLKKLAVHLFTSPPFYGQFNGAHERIHLELKNYLDKFNKHKDIVKLVQQILKYTEEHNQDFHYPYLDGKTPFEVYQNEKDFIPSNGAEIISPYEKDQELRVKFTDRNGESARMTIAQI